LPCQIGELSRAGLPSDLDALFIEELKALKKPRLKVINCLFRLVLVFAAGLRTNGLEEHGLLWTHEPCA
jgi:hypothetical protein